MKTSWGPILHDWREATGSAGSMASHTKFTASRLAKTKTRGKLATEDVSCNFFHLITQSIKFHVFQIKTDSRKTGKEAQHFFFKENQPYRIRTWNARSSPSIVLKMSGFFTKTAKMKIKRYVPLVTSTYLIIIKGLSYEWFWSDLLRSGGAWESTAIKNKWILIWLTGKHEHLGHQNEPQGTRQALHW
jgi:hypothetical protein